VRSRSAAGVLEGAGFRQAYSLAGGLTAWKGVTASGPPEAGTAYFSGAESPAELARLAWSLEEGSRRFYVAQVEGLQDAPAAELFAQLARAEEGHTGRLARYLGEEEKTLRAGGGETAQTDVMEGGIALSKGLEWAKGKKAAEILQFAMALETNAYDLYLKMAAATKKDPECLALFRDLADEERLHLERIGKLLEENLAGTGER